MSTAFQSLTDFGSRLHDALSAALACVPDLSDRPREMARVLGVNKDLTSRLHKALRAHDPLAMLAIIPGPPPLREVLTGLASLGADAQRLNAAREVIDEFDVLIREEYQDRGNLNAVLASAVPEMLRSHELAMKQTAYRGIAGYRGISVNTTLCTTVVVPNPTNPALAHHIMITGLYGLRRLRPGACLQFSTQFIRPLGNPADLRDHLPGDDESNNSHLLREFCKPHDLRVVRYDEDDIAYYEIISDTVGQSSEVDLVAAEYSPGQVQTTHPSAHWGAYMCNIIEHPTKELVHDIIIHESIWNTGRFELSIYDTASRGPVEPHKPSNHRYKIPHSEPLQFLGSGIDRLRSSKVPRYVELVRTVLARVGCDPTQFRSYRAEIAYPLYGSQICVGYHNE